MDLRFERTGVSYYTVKLNGETLGVVYKAMLGYRNYTTWRTTVCYADGKCMDSEPTLKAMKEKIRRELERSLRVK